MKISVIVPVYNVEKYISECIESIIKQTYMDWELILVDDGSTDLSGNICKQYSLKDSRIRYIYRENAGQSAARNMGIELACGMYIIFVDSDDYIEYDSLENIVNAINLNDAPDIVLSEGLREFNEGIGRVSDNKELNRDDYCGQNGRAAMQMVLDCNGSWSPCGKAYKLEYWNKKSFSFPIGRISEDFALIYRVILEANSVVCVPAFYTYRRFRNGSSASYNTKKMVLDDFKGFDDWEEYFEKNDIDSDLVDKFRYRFLALYCHDSLAYLYLFDGCDKKEVLSLIKKYGYYLKYAKTIEERAIRIMVWLVGYKITATILGIIKQIRLKKILKDE